MLIFCNHLASKHSLTPRLLRPNSVIKDIEKRYGVTGAETHVKMRFGAGMNSFNFVQYVCDATKCFGDLFPGACC